MLKRLFDFVISLTLFISFLPVIAVVALFIKLNDGGSVFYRGLRAGRNGRGFRMFKFRSMVLNADKIGGPSTSDDDPRLTQAGRWIRRFKLDEIPQLLNVLSGDMSLVGPRPEVPSEVDLYTPEERRLLSVRPGITDLASIKFHNEGEILKGSPDPHEAYRTLIRPEKIRLGLDYVQNQSLALDLKILGKTAATLVSSRMS